MYGNRNLGEIRRQEELGRGNNNGGNDDGLLADCIAMMCNACCSLIGSVIWSCCSFIGSSISSCCHGIASLCNNGNNQNPQSNNLYNDEATYGSGSYAPPVIQTMESPRSTKISLDDWFRQIEYLLKTNHGLISADSLYQMAEKYDGSGDYESATAYYWKAFVCGDGRSAYDLCIIFKDKLRSDELASIMFHFSSRQGEMNRSSSLMDQFTYTDEELEFSGKILDYLNRSKLQLKDSRFGEELVSFQIGFFDNLVSENVQILGEDSVLNISSMSQCMNIDLL